MEARWCLVVFERSTSPRRDEADTDQCTVISDTRQISTSEIPRNYFHKHLVNFLAITVRSSCADRLCSGVPAPPPAYILLPPPSSAAAAATARGLKQKSNVSSESEEAELWGLV